MTNINQTEQFVNDATARYNFCLASSLGSSSQEPVYTNINVGDEYLRQLTMPSNQVFETRSSSMNSAIPRSVAEVYQAFFVGGTTAVNNPRSQLTSASSMQEPGHEFISVNDIHEPWPQYYNMNSVHGSRAQINNATIHTPRRQLHSSSITTSGKMNLGEIEQSNLGLQHINLNNLRIALLPGPKNRKSLVWESLGHAFLKFYLATHFFSKNQYDSEGRLTKRIQSESNNKRISELILSSCIREYIGAGHSSSCSVAKRIVAAAVLSGGVTSALKTVEWLGMVKERSVTTLGGLYTQYQHHRPARTIFSFSMSNISQSQSANILHRAQLAQNILGYKFVDLEIFKNSTDNSTNEFQRLELLGDAVLEYLVADHYRSVGSLQEFNTKKTLVLTNNVLGSLFVSLGLEFTVQVAATDLNTAIEDARYKIAMNSRLDSIRVKKTLGDAMEAIVGGIFVDSGFDLNTVKEVLNRTLFPFANRSYVIKVIAGMSEDFPINLVEIRDSREGTSINNPISLVEVEDEDEEELPRVAIEKRKASPVEGEAEISRRKRFRYFRF